MLLKPSITKMVSSWKPLLLSIIKKLPLLLVAIALLYPGDEFVALKFVIGIGMFIAFMTYLTRKLMFPSLDTNDLIKLSLSNANAASIVFLSISIIISTVIVCYTWLFK